MKNTLFIMCFLCFSLSACTDKNGEKNATNTELKETINTVEKENEELKNLDEAIENDIKELDDLLKEVDEIK